MMVWRMIPSVNGGMHFVLIVDFLLLRTLQWDRAGYRHFSVFTEGWIRNDLRLPLLEVGG